LCFSRKQQDESAPNFFSRFRRKHLFITTCIEKHCTRPLTQNIYQMHRSYTDTHMKERKKIQLKSRAFNQFAMKRVCIEMDLWWDKYVSKRVAVKWFASKWSRCKVSSVSKHATQCTVNEVRSLHITGY